MNTILKSLLSLILVTLIITALSAAVALAQEPVTLPNTGAPNQANEYAGQLDELRALGSTAAARALTHPEVYDFSSDLQQLNSYAFNRTHRSHIYNGANEYITALDRLRSLQAQP